MDPNFDKDRINRMLGLHGLGSLDDPGTVQQLAYLVADHEHFRQILSKCAHSLRRQMYDAMAPYLRFKARPLDVYVSQCGELAERMQWPTLDGAGALRPFKPPAPVGSDAAIAQAAVDRAMAKGRLTLTCRKCTRVEEFYGERLVDAVQAARVAGWTYDELGGTGQEICPECPGATVN